MDDDQTRAVPAQCHPRTCADRRTVLAAAGAVGVTAALAGCQVYGTPQPAAPPPESVPQLEPGAPSAGAPSAGAAAGPVLARLADLPVGGGKIFADQKVVLTQPEPGTVRAFSSVCTHQGCAVSEIADGTINCTCHGSSFSVGDGSVTGGPAGQPLPAVQITVDGEEIRLAGP
ncbi:Rieske (2Fe-2S) protein [Solwaraspora sp. WMMD1047]|uniref:Rieske (2Fe-2S) protein n=1 Tax=Solwaraspora sp. WMMD1047 TaxID=3016102 RepID=UPI002417C641|nr:Rieske (2Fe-2S) protein [Solwaraspora sp. WMMD1047]MDG4829512.1 Rieske (2Fe-2S) protein [Solwaraspora sp. WMMD1047]